MNKSRLKVVTILGTRPEIIRLSATIKLLDRYVDHRVVHTGQNYDYELNEVFFKDLGLREPDFYLNVDTSSLGRTYGDILAKSEEVLRAEVPDAVLVLGDTNSSFGAIMAKRMHIPVFHMEAGNRSFDWNVPEEMNRRIIDHIADFNLAYTENARDHLLREGLPNRRVYVTGSPLGEVLNDHKANIALSTVLSELGLEKDRFFLVSTHRQENVDNHLHLKEIMRLLNGLAEEYDLPVIVSTHPRTRNRLEAIKDIEMDERVRFLKPFGFYDYIFLQMNARCTLSDSGTISEESAMLDFPAISLRNSMERPEAQDTGSIILTGLETDIVLNAVALAVEEKDANPYREIPRDYQVMNTSWRVLKLILGNARLSNRWHGIDQ